MDERKELAEILNRYRVSSETHDRRFFLLLDKHVENLRQWNSLVKNTPVNTTDFSVSVNHLWEQSKVIREEFHEVLQDMANDSDILVKFFCKGISVYKDEKNDNA